MKGGRGGRRSNNGKEGRARDATLPRARAPVARPPAAAAPIPLKGDRPLPAPSARAALAPPVLLSPVRPFARGSARAAASMASTIGMMDEAYFVGRELSRGSAR